MSRAIAAFAILFALAAVAVPCAAPEAPPAADTGPARSDAGRDAAPATDAAIDAYATDLPPLPADGVATLAGAGEAGDRDGPRGTARFSNPTGIALGPRGDLFVADFDNDLVRRVTPEGRVTTVLRQKNIARPFGLAFAPDGTLYLQTDGDDRGRRDTTTGTIWRVDVAKGRAVVVARHLGRPRGLAVLADGRLVLSDYVQHTLRILDPRTGRTVPLAGKRGAPGHRNGRGEAARFSAPYGVAIAPGGIVYVADRDNNRIRRVDLAGNVTDYAGSGRAGRVDDVASRAAFDHPRAIAADARGNLYVADTGSYAVRLVTPAGATTTLAGAGHPGFRDGPAREALFFGLEGIAATGGGARVYVSDGNRGTGAPFNRVRLIVRARP